MTKTTTLALLIAAILLMGAFAPTGLAQNAAIKDTISIPATQPFMEAVTERGCAHILTTVMDLNGFVAAEELIAAPLAEKTYVFPKDCSLIISDEDSEKKGIRTIAAMRAALDTQKKREATMRHLLSQLNAGRDRESKLVAAVARHKKDLEDKEATIAQLILSTEAEQHRVRAEKESMFRALQAANSRLSDMTYALAIVLAIVLGLAIYGRYWWIQRKKEFALEKNRVANDAVSEFARNCAVANKKKSHVGPDRVERVFTLVSLTMVNGEPVAEYQCPLCDHPGIRPANFAHHLAHCPKNKTNTVVPITQPSPVVASAV